MDTNEQAREALTTDELAEKYCEGLCRDSGFRGAFHDCTGCEIILAALSPTTPVDGVGAEPRKLFPILGSGGQKIDFGLVADHGKQAKANHYQSVERLAERGGLSWSELYAVLHDQRWQKMDENDAIVACRQLEARYLSALANPEAEARLRERERVAELERLIHQLRTSQPDNFAVSQQWKKRAEAAEARLAQAERGPAVTEAAREFMALFARDDGLTLEEIDPNEMAQKYEALEAALHPQSAAGEEGKP